MSTLDNQCAFVVQLERKDYALHGFGEASCFSL